MSVASRVIFLFVKWFFFYYMLLCCNLMFVFYGQVRFYKAYKTKNSYLWSCLLCVCDVKYL